LSEFTDGFIYAIPFKEVLIINSTKRAKSEPEHTNSKKILTISICFSNILATVLFPKIIKITVNKISIPKWLKK
jgi:hypothetical protein